MQLVQGPVLCRHHADKRAFCSSIGSFLKCLYNACRQELPQPEPSMAALAVEGMSLDRFMAKHTSEDNASFAQIMEESNKRRRLSKPWLFEQKDKVSIPLPPHVTSMGACCWCLH